MKEKDKKEHRSHSRSDSGHESDFVTRLKECLREEPIKAFARRCGIPESNLRSYLVRGKKPTLENLSKIASTAGVTIDWLATGQGVKDSAELRRLMQRDECPSESAERQPEPEASFPKLQKHAGQMEAIMKLLEDIEDEGDRAMLLNDFFARAQNAKQMDELKRTVADLRAAQQKTG
jgi:transcriptional regulator with XRE-family HTH domain